MRESVEDVFRHPSPTDENLAELASLAYTVSAHECGACRNYHVTWPYLRLIGANGNGPERFWERSQQAIKPAIAGRPHTRWLIAGSADAGVSALLWNSCRAFPDITHQITVVDRCGTPLALADAYARSVGAPISVINADLMTFVRDAGFDVILFHATFLHFDADQRVAFLRHARRSLAPNGSMLIFMPYYRDVVGDRPPSRAKWRQAMIERALEEGVFHLPEAKETFLQRIENRHDPARDRLNTFRWSLDDLKETIAKSGLSIVRQVDFFEDGEEAAATGTDARPRVMLEAKA